MKRYWQSILLGILSILTLTSCGLAGADPAEKNAHTHVWGTWVETVIPSCTQEGKHERTCSACGETETKLIHPLGHRESAWITDPGRNCLIDTAKHTMCITCGETLQTEIIYAEGHTESDWIVDIAVTCVVDGKRHKICNSCKSVTESETVYAVGHQNSDWIIGRAATCTVDGVQHKVCSICNQTTETETIYSAGHQNGDWIIDRAATCLTDGMRHKTCSVCGVTTLNEKIYHAGHRISGWIVDRAPTCTVEGIRHQSCTNCDEMLKSETLAVVHNEVIDAVVAATCKSTGLTLGKHCADCGTILLEQYPIETTDHIYGQDGLCTGCGMTDERYLKFTWQSGNTYSVSAKDGVEMPSQLIIPVTYSGKAVTQIANNAFEGCTTIKTVTIPSTVTKIGEFAFYGCSALQSVVVPDGVETIEQKTFYNCSKLADVTLPDSVTELGAAAFSGCKSLTNIQIPRGVTSLSGSLFGGCGFTTFYIPDHITDIGTYAFVNCENLTSVVISESVSRIRKEAFKETPLEKVYYPGDESVWAKIEIDAPNDVLLSAKIVDASATAYLEFNAQNGSVRAKDVNNLPEVLFIPAEYQGKPITTIDNSAFQGATSLKKVIIREGVTTIRSNAFRDCINLTSVTLPQTLTTIEFNAFRNCTGLTSLILPDSLTVFHTFYGDLPNKVFNTDEQGNMYLGTASNPYLILTQVSSNTRSLVTHADTVFIGEYAFSNCGRLVDVTISEGVRSIGQTAFSYCQNLSSVSFPSTLTELPTCGLFYNCPNLTSITVAADNPIYINVGNCIIDKDTKTLVVGHEFSVIPADGSVVKIGAGAFQQIELTEIVIPEGITEIHDSAFRYCEQLTSVVLPSTVKMIEDQVFAGCHSLTSLSVVEGNPYFTSQNNSIIRTAGSILVASASNVVPEGVKKIQTGTFYTSEIQQLYLPASLTEIEYYTFNSCENLTNVYYAGTAEQWAKIKIGEQNDSLLNAKIHFSSTAP